MRGRAAPPHPRIYRVPPPPGLLATKHKKEASSEEGGSKGEVTSGGPFCLFVCVEISEVF